MLIHSIYEDSLYIYKYRNKYMVITIYCFLLIACDN